MARTGRIVCFRSEQKTHSQFSTFFLLNSYYISNNRDVVGKQLGQVREPRCSPWSRATTCDKGNILYRIVVNEGINPMNRRVMVDFSLLLINPSSFDEQVHKLTAYYEELLKHLHFLFSSLLDMDQMC